MGRVMVFLCECICMCICVKRKIVYNFFYCRQKQGKRPKEERWVREGKGYGKIKSIYNFNYKLSYSKRTRKGCLIDVSHLT